MNKKEKNILIILLFCASAVLMILYSPIGAREANNYTNSYIQNYDVVVGSGIENAPKASFFENNRSSSIFGGSSMPTNAILHNANLPASSSSSILAGTGARINGNSHVSVAGGSLTKQLANYAVANTTESVAGPNMAFAAYKGQTYSNNRFSGASEVGDGRLVAALPNAIYRNDTNTENKSQISFPTTNNDLTSTNDLTVNQGGGYTPGSGATDPGEDPLGEPIPVSDGFWFLLLMAIAYCYILFVKKKSMLKKSI